MTNKEVSTDTVLEVVDSLSSWLDIIKLNVKNAALLRSLITDPKKKEKVGDNQLKQQIAHLRQLQIITKTLSEKQDCKEEYKLILLIEYKRVSILLDMYKRFVMDDNLTFEEKQKQALWILNSALDDDDE
jgi:hypothetical protein